jgi:hypothetical protein
MQPSKYEIQNSAQMISCIPVLHTQRAHFYLLRLSAVYLASKPTFTRENSGHSLGTLTADLSDLLMHTEKWMDRMILLDLPQGIKVPKLPGNIKPLPLR